MISRRRVLSGLIAAPAVLVLGAHMPISAPRYVWKHVWKSASDARPHHLMSNDSGMWIEKTPQEILDDINNILQTLWSQSTFCEIMPPERCRPLYLS